MATAKRFVEEGAHVVITGRREKELAEAAAFIRRNVTTVVSDVSSLEDLDRLYAAVADSGRRLDVVFANAATIDVARIGDITEEQLDNQLDVDFKGVVFTVQKALPMFRDGGSITLTDGMVAQRPQPGSAVSTAMAGAIEHLIRGLALDLAPLRVNGVCPGAINTHIWETIPAATREAMTKRLPVGRIGEPDEAAEAYLYLMRAGYTTGQVLYVDGGQSVI